MAGKIRNIGPKSAAWLRQVGIRTIDDLRREGPVDTFLKVKRAGFRPSLNLLYSMEGALVDCHWTDLSDERKQQLISDYESAESADPILTRWQKQVERSLDRDGDGNPADDAASDDAGEGSRASDDVGELNSDGGEFS